GCDTLKRFTDDVVNLVDELLHGCSPSVSAVALPSVASARSGPTVLRCCVGKPRPDTTYHERFAPITLVVWREEACLASSGGQFAMARRWVCVDKGRLLDYQ